jgi:HAD superfamily hydrolase (TIGR01549 family)
VTADHPLLAVIWDFDGTLVDTHAKNLNVTRTIFARLTGRDPDGVPALSSVATYARLIRKTSNWRTLYMDEFGFTAEQTNRAGELWADYQLRDDTPALLYPGIVEVVQALAGTPQGIFSQNSRETISGMLKRERLAGLFRMIVGYEEVSWEQQKPEPAGLLACIEALTNRTAGYVLYVGDHETDARCGQNGNRALASRGVDIRVRVVGAAYGGGAPEDWPSGVDHTAATARDVLTIAHHYAGSSP